MKQSQCSVKGRATDENPVVTRKIDGRDVAHLEPSCCGGGSIPGLEVSDHVVDAVVYGQPAWCSAFGWLKTAATERWEEKVIERATQHVDELVPLQRVSWCDCDRDAYCKRESGCFAPSPRFAFSLRKLQMYTRLHLFPFTAALRVTSTQGCSGSSGLHGCWPQHGLGAQWPRHSWHAMRGRRRAAGSAG